MYILLCYGGLGDEEVHEVIHESFDEKECYDNVLASLSLLIMRVFEVVDEKREKWSTRSRSLVKDEARGTEERGLDDKRKQRVQHLRETDEYFHLFINAEMLMIAARTHAV